MKSIDIHQANVTGLGAEKFALSLLRHLMNNENISVQNIYVNRLVSRENTKSANNVILVNYFFGAFSRLLEIFFWRLCKGKENDFYDLNSLKLLKHFYDKEDKTLNEWMKD